MYNHNGRKCTKNQSIRQKYKALQDIHDNQIDDSDRNGDQCTVKSVKKSAMTWDYVSGILDIVMSLPLGFDKIAVDTCNTE